MSAEPAKVARHGVSFQSRVTIVAMITAVAVLLAACAAFIAEQWRADQQNNRRVQAAVTEPFATGPTLRAAFTDRALPPSRASILMQRYGGFRAVFLADPQGRLVSGAGAASPAAARARGLIETEVPVTTGRQTLGRLITFTDPPLIWTILPRYLALTAALFFAAMGLALFLGRWLAGRVTEPVNRLSDAMNAVAAGGDFTQRVERVADDELGRLTECFNDLLSRLHHNDRALRRTMDELVEARDTAQSANRLKSQFLANMSHEIRTPLNGLLAMSQVMAMEELSAVQRGRLDVVRQSGEALLAILNDVLDVSKIEAGKLELEIDDFDTEAMLRAVLAPFGAVAERKGLALVLDLRPDAAGTRRGDSTRLRQIVSNLVSNALKFTEAGEVLITVEGRGESGRAGLAIAVRDTGIGIPEAAMPNLFQTFTQADSSTTRRFGGTGLGLAICHELSDLMGGSISVESEQGVGSTFRVVLPLERVEAAPTLAPQPAAAEEAATHDDRPIRVLAAEDNPTNQLVLSTVMNIFGVDLTLVDNGRKAVDAWRDGAFDLILMDIQMPEMDGLTATRAIRAAEGESGRARIPIIALSAHAMTHQVKEYLAAGIDLHVPKPIELPKLQAALDHAMTLTAAAEPGATADHAPTSAMV